MPSTCYHVLHLSPRCTAITTLYRQRCYPFKKSYSELMTHTFSTTSTHFFCEEIRTGFEGDYRKYAFTLYIYNDYIMIILYVIYCIHWVWPPSQDSSDHQDDMNHFQATGDPEPNLEASHDCILGGGHTRCMYMC